MTAQNKRESGLFLIATYVFSALMWGALILMHQPPTSSAIAFALYLLGGLSPTIFALLLPLRSARGGRRAYYNRYFNFRVSMQWYVLPVVVALLMKYMSDGFLYLFFRESLKPLNLQPWYMIFPLFIQMIIGGGLEEIGWRGVLVHRYQRSNPALVALVIGVIWACWHIPLFFIQGVSQYNAEFLPFFINVIGLSFVTAVLYIRSQSAVPCIIFHALVNALLGMGSISSSNPTANIIADIMKYAVVAVFFLAFSIKAADTARMQQAQI